jgi:hypothetical protein
MKVDLTDVEWAYVFTLVKNDCVARKQLMYKNGNVGNSQEAEKGMQILDKIKSANERKWSIANKDIL